jgi:hypothetical protein
MSASEAKFDYDAISVPNRRKLRSLAKRIKDKAARQLSGVVEIGAWLKGAKDDLLKEVGHGHFLRWVAAEFHYTPRTAQTYMRLAEAYQGKCEAFSLLGLRTALDLADAPAEIRDEFFDRAKAGEVLRDDEVRAALDSFDEAPAPEPPRAVAPYQPCAPAVPQRPAQVVAVHAQSPSYRLVSAGPIVSAPREPREPETVLTTPDWAKLAIQNVCDDFTRSAGRLARDTKRREEEVLDRLIEQTLRQPESYADDLRWLLGFLGKWKAALDNKSPEPPARPHLRLMI